MYLAREWSMGIIILGYIGIIGIVIRDYIGIIEIKFY